MRLRRTLVILVSASFLAFSSIVPADGKTFSNLSDLNKESFVLGDVIKINAQCWSSARAGDATGRKKLEIFNAGKWKSVGKIQFTKTKECSVKFPYGQFLVWEVDRLGTIDKDGLGTLRIRESVNSPSSYAKIFIYESAEARNDVYEIRKARGYEIAQCVIFDGQWDSNRDICVGATGP
jgi:hypothetical protein